MKNKIINLNVQDYYDRMNKEYLKCWSSRAKKDISGFELRFVRNCLRKAIKQNKAINVLEIGPGPGRIADEILKHKVNYYAVDVSGKMVQLIKYKYSANKKFKDIEVGDIANKIPFKKVNFDVIIAMRVIYYNKSWKNTVKIIKERLKPNGTLVFCMLNRNSTAILGKILADSLVGYYATYKDLVGVLRKNTFKKISIMGYARIPDVVYDYARSKKGAFFLKVLESILSRMFGKTLFIRMFYVSANK